MNEPRSQLAPSWLSCAHQQRVRVAEDERILGWGPSFELFEGCAVAYRTSVAAGADPSRRILSPVDGRGKSDQARDLVLVGCSGGDVDGHGEPWVGGELHFDYVDVDHADAGVADGDAPGEGLFDVVAAPPLAELLAFFLEGADQLGEAFVAGVLGDSGAELAEEVASALLPADGSTRGGALGEVEPLEVPPSLGERGWLPEPAV